MICFVDQQGLSAKVPYECAYLFNKLWLPLLLLTFRCYNRYKYSRYKDGKGGSSMSHFLK